VAQPALAPPANDNALGTVLSPLGDPPHTRTESTQAPTSEFWRIFLNIWIVRYLPRGLFGEAFDPLSFDFIKKPMDRFIKWAVVPGVEKRINGVLTAHAADIQQFRFSGQELQEGSSLFDRLRPMVNRWRGDKDDILHIISHAQPGASGALKVSEESLARLYSPVRKGLSAIAYALSIGIGSGYLTWRYSLMVKRDINNMFREAVAYEFDKPEADVAFSDIAASQNQIVQRTVYNYRSKMYQRFATDALFFLASPLKSLGIVDALLGVKGIQLFTDTWKRKTTMFEDIVSLVNNKINPRNGLGQLLNMGDVLDLYQHYTQEFYPERMFTNVTERNPEESALWAKNRPVFHRITDLMNESYAYKHETVMDAKTGTPVPSQHFTLPVLIYLLGHDLIDPNDPAKTLFTVEVVNKFGVPKLREALGKLRQGETVEKLAGEYGISLALKESHEEAKEKRGVVREKASGMQPMVAEEAPHTKISAHQAEHHKAHTHAGALLHNA
jgi:hypothetical protein